MTGMRGPVRIAMVAILVVTCAFNLCLDRGEAIGDVPEGYLTLDDLARTQPDLITLVGEDYVVSGDIDIPAAHPLYMAPGESVLFKEGSSLMLRGSPVLRGTESDRISFGPFADGVSWDGIGAVGTSPNDALTLRNATVSSASVGVRLNGMALYSSDVSVVDCESTGIEVRDVPPERATSLERTNIQRCRFYGISIWDSGPISIRTATIESSTTGIRAYKGSIAAIDCEIVNSTGNALQLVGSSFTGTDLLLSTDRSAGFSTQAQLSASNSTIRLAGSRIGFANRGIQAIKGSSVDLSDCEIGPTGLQGIYLEGGHIDMTDSSMHDCSEGGLYALASEFHIRSAMFERNGGGHGETRSNIIAVNSSGWVEGSTFLDHQRSDLECYGCTVTISNSTMNTSGHPLVLGDSSTVTLGNMRPPSGTQYLDPFSRTRYLFFMRVHVTDHASGAPHSGAVVDVRDRSGAAFASAVTGADGLTPFIGAIVYTNNSIETRSRMPLTVFASDDAFEISSMTLPYPRETIEMVLYPPNEAPTLWIGSPKEGAIARSMVLVSGIVRDDLGSRFLSVRMDTAGSSIIALDQNDDGSFTVDFPLLQVASGHHLLELRAFDGTHLSAPSIRNITVLNPITSDSDDDGLTDYIEDGNGNGIVDPGETDPFDSDSDDDGLIDGIEDRDGDGTVDPGETDPTDPDSDSDYLLDGVEDVNGNGRVDANETDPLDPDSDHDGIDDRDDPLPLQPGGSPPTTMDDSDLAVLILSTMVFILALVTIYLLFIRVDPGRGRSRATYNKTAMKRSKEGAFGKKKPR